MMGFKYFVLLGVVLSLMIVILHFEDAKIMVIPRIKC